MPRDRNCNMPWSIFKNFTCSGFLIKILEQVSLGVGPIHYAKFSKLCAGGMPEEWFLFEIWNKQTRPPNPKGASARFSDGKQILYKIINFKRFWRFLNNSWLFLLFQDINLNYIEKANSFQFSQFLSVIFAFVVSGFPMNYIQKCIFQNRTKFSKIWWRVMIQVSEKGRVIIRFWIVPTCASRCRWSMRGLQHVGAGRGSSQQACGAAENCASVEQARSSAGLQPR